MRVIIIKKNFTAMYMMSLCCKYIFLFMKHLYDNKSNLILHYELIVQIFSNYPKIPIDDHENLYKADDL